MLRLFFAVFLLILCACNTKKAPATDPETNLYEKQYRDIYTGYQTDSSVLTRQKLLSYLEAYPDDKNALHFLGRVEYDMGNYTASLNAYKREYMQDTTQPRAIVAMGVIYRLAGNYREATNFLNRALMLEDSRAALAALACNMLEQGDTATAVNMASRAYSKDSLSPISIIGFADICRRAKQDSIFAVLKPKAEAAFKNNSDVAAVWSGDMSIDRFYGKYKL